MHMRGTRREREVEIYATNLAMNVRAISQFLLHIFQLSPSELAWSQIIKLL
jgi:hypothetical protein